MNKTQDPHHSISSYALLHGERTLSKLGPATGETILDLGCGPGEYTIRIAGLTGNDGRVLAVDQNPQALDTLRKRAADLGLGNIDILQQDFCAPLPLPPAGADAVLLCTVLHHPAQRQRIDALLDGICPLLRPGGRLVIVEMHKKETPFGPPLNVRIAAEDLEPQVCAHGMKRTGYQDLGAAYLLRFSPA